MRLAKATRVRTGTFGCLRRRLVRIQQRLLDNRLVRRLVPTIRQSWANNTLRFPSSSRLPALLELQRRNVPWLAVVKVLAQVLPRQAHGASATAREARRTRITSYRTQRHGSPCTTLARSSNIVAACMFSRRGPSMAPRRAPPSVHRPSVWAACRGPSFGGMRHACTRRDPTRSASPP